LLRVVDDLFPELLHDTTQYANNRVAAAFDELAEAI
jgi:hypothetical protein